MSDSVRGSCLCGGVRFEVTLPFLRVNHCHCTTCQKHSGTVHSTSGRATPEQIRFTQGRELVKAYRPAPGEGNKAFCSRCGSSLFGGGWPDGPYISVRFGALDDDPGQRPQLRTFVSSNAPWYDIPDDGLPRYDRQTP
jgi:hypothetical protein